MSVFAACTIVAHNYLPQARILAQSFREHHPESTFYIVVVDRPVEARLIQDDGYKVLPITEIDFGDEGFEHMAAIYDVTEFATSVKPFALRQLVQKHDCVFYIDPDIKLFAPLTPLIEKTMEHGWSLTPHSLEPIVRNGWQPTEQEIKGAGIYNLGYAGVSKSAIAMLDWWCERLRRDSIVDVPNQLFTDQRWIDMAVAIFPAYIERTTSYNVAYWNLDQRRLWKDGHVYMVDDDVLRFFHFSGYDPTSPHWISKYQHGRPRVLLSENDVLTELCEQYGAEMLAIRDEIASSAGYGWRNIVPGLPFTKYVRRYLRDELLEAESEGFDIPPTPFATNGAKDFVMWLKGIRPTDPTRLPRYLAAIYWNRPDLQHHFGEVRDGVHGRFRGWCLDNGVREEAIIRAFGVPNEVGDPKILNLQVLPIEPNGIDVFGYLKAELGVGEAGRLAVKALRAADVNVSTVSYEKTISRQNIVIDVDNVLRHKPLLMAVNADQIASCRLDLGVKALEDKYVIGQWFWELEEFPDHYQRSFELVDELWAPTQFIADCLRAKAPKELPIHHMPLPLVAPPVDAQFDRSFLNIGEQFMFLFTFDFFSVEKRKNPIGVIDAFRRAFPHQGEAVLVLKTINGHKKLNDLEKVRWYARKRSDVLIVDEYMDSRQVASLMASADAYVSLHRSEGLGLTMAEAMLLGTPVIATGYSGNLDFMNESNSILVPWKRAKVGPGADAYSPTSYWAEPNLEAAALAMRRLVNEQDFAAELGRTAQQDLLTRFSAEATGVKMKQRLEEIWSGRNGK